ncbi:MAG: hypothetical protein KKG92_01935 [Gammaproteobacteria bacterium]|nr:hypothetical protein [Gammaproteobacteria bacterium]
MPTPQPPQASPDPMAKPHLTLVPKPPAGAIPTPQANTTCYHLIEHSPPYLILLTPELLADEAVLAAWVEKSATAKNQR